MITTAAQGNLVSVSVMGEFTMADYKDFEEHVLYRITSYNVCYTKLLR